VIREPTLVDGFTRLSYFLLVQVKTATPSAAATARRTQIVAATIGTIAEEGYAGASFARIAERAGLSSTRLISYHFAGKDELIGSVVQHVLTGIAAYVGGRIDEAEATEGEGNATAILRAYVEGNVAFIDEHRTEMHALLQIVLASGGLPGAQSGGLPGSRPRAPGATGDQGEIPLEGLLRHGQRTGEFRDFDVPTVAGAIQRAIEGLPFVLAAQPGLDCRVYGAELVELYLRGVRRDAA
jgi:AcrR family transcriptional regulator